FGQHINVFRQELTGRFKVILRQPVLRKLVQFIKRRSQREQPVLRLDRANPNLEDLLLAIEVRIRMKLEHPSREVLNVSVVAVVQSSNRAKPLVQITVARAMLSEI